MQGVPCIASISKQPVSIHFTHYIRFSHAEADPLSIIDAIHERKMRAGVAISPDTPSTAITDEIGAAADMLLVMTVYPGKYHVSNPEHQQKDMF